MLQRVGVHHVGVILGQILESKTYSSLLGGVLCSSGIAFIDLTLNEQPFRFRRAQCCEG